MAANSIKNCVKKIYFFTLIIFLIIFLIIPGFIRAEEIQDAVALGGITLDPKLAAELQIKSQKITISHDKIQIESVLINNSDKPLEGQVSFTLPETPSHYTNPDAGSTTWDEAYYQLMYEAIEKATISKEVAHKVRLQHFYELGQERRNAPFLDFRILVNGKNIATAFKTKCILGIEDITEIMIKNNIPISADFVINMFGILPGIESREQIAENVKIKDPSLFARLFDERSYPVWKNQTTYFWQQKFLTGEPVTIHLSYTPAFGFVYENHSQESLSTEQSTAQFLEKNVRYNTGSQKRTVQEFCPNESCMNVIKAFFSHEKEDFHILRIFEVNVLPFSVKDKPIEKFRLEIIQPNNGEIALCWPKDLEKETNKKLYFVEHDNFISGLPIMVLFIDDYK